MKKDRLKLGKLLQSKILQEVYGSDETEFSSWSGNEARSYIDEDTGEYILMMPNGKIIKKRSKTVFRDLCKGYGYDLPEIFQPMRHIYAPEKPHGFGKGANGTVYNTYSESPFQKESIDKGSRITTTDFPTIDNLLMNLFKEKKIRKAFLNWLSAIFNSGVKTCTAWIIIGAPGSGKNTLFKSVIEPLLGRSNCRLLNQDAIESRFNRLLEGRQLVCFNEVRASSKGQDRIKTWITEDTLVMEKKGRDGEIVQNPTNFIFISNNVVPVSVERDDRRFSVVQAGPPLRSLNWFHGDKTFKDIRSELLNFAKYLKRYPFDVNKARVPINTDYKKALVETSRDNFEKFSSHLRSNGHDWVKDNITTSKYSKGEMSELSEFDGHLDKDLAVKVYEDIFDEKVTTTRLTQKLKLYNITDGKIQVEGGRNRCYKWPSAKKGKKSAK